MTDLTLTPKQTLALELVKVMDLEENLRLGLAEMKRLPPFNEEPALFERYLDRSLQALRAERAAFVEITEQTYSEEELRFLLEMYSQPLWKAVMDKLPLYTQNLSGMLTRVMESITREH